MARAMDDGCFRPRKVPAGAQEDIAWEHNLAVIRQALSRRHGDGEARLCHALQALDRDLALLKARLALRAQVGARDGSQPGGEENLAWLDRLIAAKRRRREQLASLRAGLPARGASHEQGPTSEAACRPARRDPIEELGERRRPNSDQVRAALEIRFIHEAVTRMLRTKTIELGCARDRQAWRASDMPARLSRARQRRYLPWAENLRAVEPETLDIVLRVAVYGVSIFAVARRHRLRWGTCLEKLRRGLDLYWKGGRERVSIAGNPAVPGPGHP